jgi:hypothetical protein
MDDCNDTRFIMVDYDNPSSRIIVRCGYPLLVTSVHADSA